MWNLYFYFWNRSYSVNNTAEKYFYIYSAIHFSSHTGTLFPAILFEFWLILSSGSRAYKSCNAITWMVASPLKQNNKIFIWFLVGKLFRELFSICTIKLKLNGGKWAAIFGLGILLQSHEGMTLIIWLYSSVQGTEFRQFRQFLEYLFRVFKT